MQKITKILIIRFSSLGDVILTTPLIKILKQNFPEARIDYITKAAYADILKHNPNVDRIIPVDDNLDFSGLKNLKKLIKDNVYNLIIDAHSNLRTFYLRLFLDSHAKILKFKKYSIRKFLLVNFKINFMKNLPLIAERYIEIIKPIIGTPFFENLNNQKQIPLFYTDEESRQKTSKLFIDLNLPADSRLICIIPSAKHFTKTYPPKYFAELINKLGNSYKFLLIGKGSDKKNIEAIISKTGNNVYDLCDKLPVLDLAEIMKRCSLVISGDTGPMHIAESLNIPLIMIAGSSVREFGFYPQSKNSTVVENEGLPCRPCTHIGRSSCPKEHFKCMMDLKPEIIFRKVEIQL